MTAPSRTRTRASRSFAALALLCALTLTGCGALEELDSAAAMLEKNEPAAKPSSTAASTGAAPGEEKKRPLGWDNVKTIHAGELDGSIIRCQLGGSTQFMRADQCRSRGGRVGEV